MVQNRYHILHIKIIDPLCVPHLSGCMNRAERDLQWAGSDEIGAQLQSCSHPVVLSSRALPLPAPSKLVHPPQLHSETHPTHCTLCHAVSVLQCSPSEQRPYISPPARTKSQRYRPGTFPSSPNRAPVQSCLVREVYPSQYISERRERRSAFTTIYTQISQHVRRSVAIPDSRPHQCRQPVPPSLFHHHVQRSRMVRYPGFPARTQNRPRSTGRIWCGVQDERRCADEIPHSDYINPIDLCNRLNTYIVPEAAVHAFLTFLFLINGYWLALILNLPLLAWNAKK